MKTPLHSRRGFTLIELMVALVAGSFVVAGAYYLSNVSARLFNEQVRRAETQMTLRTASEQLRRDIGRAGFMAMRDTDELWGCNGVQGDLSVSPVRQQGVRVVRTNGQVILYLTGNFTTSDQYPLDVSSQPGRLVLSPLREGFRRSFTNPASSQPYPVSFMPQRFLSAFAPNPNDLSVLGRMVSIQDLSTGRIYFSDIIGLNQPGTNGPQIVINPPLPSVGGCIPSLTTLAVAPISTIRYMVENPAGDPELSTVAGTTALTGGTRLALVRREVSMPTNNAATPTVIPGTARVVLDFVPALDSFQVEGVWDQAMIIGAPPAVPVLQYTPTPDTLVRQASLRSLVIVLVGGSAEVSPGGAIDPDPARAARVTAGRRLTRMEIFMPNMARNPGML